MLARTRLHRDAGAERKPRVGQWTGRRRPGAGAGAGTGAGQVCTTSPGAADGTRPRLGMSKVPPATSHRPPGIGMAHSLQRDGFESRDYALSSHSGQCTDVFGRWHAGFWVGRTTCNGPVDADGVHGAGHQRRHDAAVLVTDEA